MTMSSSAVTRSVLRRWCQLGMLYLCQAFLGRLGALDTSHVGAGGSSVQRGGRGQVHRIRKRKRPESNATTTAAARLPTRRQRENRILFCIPCCVELLQRESNTNSSRMQIHSRRGCQRLQQCPKFDSGLGPSGGP
jgi:hypothetical protein